MTARLPDRSAVIPAGTWLFDDGRSDVEFELRCIFGLKLRGRFASFVGFVEDGGAAIAVETDEVRARFRWLERVYRSSRVLDAARHPLLRVQTVPHDELGVAEVKGRKAGVQFLLTASDAAAAHRWGCVRVLARATLDVQRRRRFCLVRSAALFLTLTAFRAHPAHPTPS
jgi:hypothetical protein